MESSETLSPYSAALAEYLHIGSEEALYRASLLSNSFIEQGLGPEEIVAMHSEEVLHLAAHAPARDRARLYSNSMQFLLEVMIAYGIRYKAYTELKLTETTRQVELRIELERAMAAERIRAEEAALKSKEEFLRFIAHELRTPVAALYGHIQLMQRREENKQPERLQQSLEMMAHSIEGLNRLVRNLLDLSRAESGTSMGNVPVVEIDLAAMLNSLVETLDLAADQKGVRVQLNLPEALPPLRSQRMNLESIFSNLLSNAVKYSHADGQVRVTVMYSAGELRCAIADEGVGIAPEDLPHIFEKYYRGHNVAQANQGIGIGLAVAARAAESLGGHLEVESTLGRGSTFTLVIPLV